MKLFRKRNLISLILCAAILFSVPCLVVSGAGADEGGSANFAVEYTTAVGERVDIRSFIEFDEDDTSLVRTEVRFSEDNTAVQTQDLSFVPERAGVYKITLIKSANGSLVSSYYYVRADYSEKAITVNEPAFPNAFVNGETYTLEAPESYVYSQENGKVAAEFSVTAAYGENEQALGEDLSFTPEVTRSGDTVRIEYTIEGASDGNETVLSYDIPVVILQTDGQLSMENAFVRRLIDDVKLEGSYYTAYTSTSGASLAFCNPIPADNFAIRWRMLADYNRFDELIVTLTDYRNPEERVDLSFTAGDEDNTFLSINGGSRFPVESSFRNGSFTIEYSASTHIISDSNGSIATVERSADGGTFGGFSSGIVNVTVSFGRVRGYSAVALSHIGNQSLSGISRDSISPYIFFEEEVRVRYELGETITINSAQAYDILDPDAQITVSVYKLNADGTVSSDTVTDENGVPVQDYDCSSSVSFPAEEICQYRVQYTAVDWNNRRSVRTYIYSVIDNQPPEVTFGNIQATANVNGTIQLPSVSYTDNMGAENVTVMITYLTPSNVLEVVPAGQTSFQPTQTGTYKITYFVYDASYNYVMREYVVNVV